MDFLTGYTDVCEDLKGLFRSRLKMQVLLSLSQGHKTLAELREVTGSSSQALIPKIRALESQHLVNQGVSYYHLTPIGMGISGQIGQIVRYMGTIKKNSGFWTSHNLEHIPLSSLTDLYMLYNSQTIGSVPDDVMIEYGAFVEIMNTSTRVYGLYPVMSHLHADAIIERVIRGIVFEIIVSDSVAEQLLTERYRRKIKELQQNYGLQIYRTQDMSPFSLTVTDSSLLISMFMKGTGTFDSTQVLVSSDPAALEWGGQLMQHYQSRSMKMDF